MSDPAPAAEASRIVRFGAFELDRRTGELRKSGLRVGLQDQPLQVLQMLLERRGELVTREELRQRLWPGDTFVDFEQGLNAAVKRLRSVLGDAADVPRFIETLPRRGYRWIHPIAPSGPTADVDQGSPAARGMRRRTVRKKWLAVAATVVAAAALAAMWWTVRLRRSVSDSRPRVVPLTNLKGAETDPALSPDGTHVAFCWDGDGRPGLYVKRIGSDTQVRVAEAAAGLFSPTWSPDGREIAFLRHPAPPARVDEIVVVPASGGSERLLGTSIGQYHGLDWSPDGRLLAFVGKESSEAPDAIHLLSLDTGERRRLTTPAVAAITLAGDYRPAFSPDGRSVAFIRRGDVDPNSTGLHTQEIAASASQPVTAGHEIRDVAWLADGRSLVFVAGRAPEPNLWVVDAPGGKARLLSAEDNVATVATARGSSGVAFARQTADIDVWRASGPSSARKQPPQPLLLSPRTDTHPDYSPDGTRIAFASARVPPIGIWTCAEGGDDCVAFKAEGGLAAPRWSPDGQSIAAVGWRDGVPNDVYRLEVSSRFVRRLTTDNALDTMPSWSRDGRWLYFASNRTGTFEIWKMPSTGGEARQLTRRGGAVAHETTDGRTIYFSSRMPSGNLWKMPAEGGDPTLVLDTQIHHYKWTLWQDRIIYMEERPQAEHVVMLDPKTQTNTRLMSLEPGRFRTGLDVSPDGAWILYAQAGELMADILMLEDIR